MVSIAKKLVAKKQKELKSKKKQIPTTEKSITVSKSNAPSNAPKFVSSEKLNWKKVAIPDTLDDYEGFCGLEEINGVDVKVVNGRVQFIVKEDKDIRSAEEIKKDRTSFPEGEFEVDKDDIKDEDIHNANANEEESSEKVVAVGGEETNEKEVEVIPKKESTTKEKKQVITRLVTRNDQDDEKEIPELTEKNTKQTKKEKKAKKQKDKKFEDEELASNAFSAVTNAQDLELPDDDISLPEWTDSIPNLSAFTLTGLSKLGFKKPTEIQKQTIPPAIEGSDVIGKAITGSGKTLAYGIPILEKALNGGKLTTKEAPNGIVFAPTRELATQVMKHLKELIKYSSLPSNSIISLTGGLSIQKQERLLSYNPRIIVATPGRFLEILEKTTEVATKLASTDIVIFDEADRLLTDGHFEELSKILEVMTNHRPTDQLLNKKWQSLVFSATFSKDLFGKLDDSKKTAESKKRKADGEEDETKKVLQLLGKKLRFRGRPSYIDVNPTEVVANRITEAMIPCGTTERDLMLYYFLTLFPGSTLVFTNSIDSVKRLAPTLNNLGLPTVSLHSSMIQKQRLRSLERFQKNCEIAVKQNKSAVLIASDVAARGLDLPNIKHVIHYHLPRTAGTYIHRSGRTARAGKEGVSLILCSPQEASGPLRNLRKIVTKDDEVDDLKTLPLDMDILDQLKERLDIAAKLAQSEINSQTINKENSWIEKAAEELGIENLSDLEEDDFLKRDRKRKEGKKIGKDQSKVLRAQLRQLLNRQVRRSGRTSYITGGLNSIADLLMKNENRDNIMGHLQQDALEVLKSSKRSKKRKIAQDS